MNGVLIIDKPQDFTSFDVVAVLRKTLHEKKIGHTGTLDPMATGVLPVLVGKATRAIPFLQDTEKEYEAEFQLGMSTDTQDITGKTVKSCPNSVSEKELKESLTHFRGNILQTPPMYSAVSQNGHRLYELARKGIEVEREQRPVTIEKLELLSYDELKRIGKLKVACSKGTYIRTLCSDIGDTLGVGAVLTSLRRTRACGFTLEDSFTLDNVKISTQEGNFSLLPIDTLFSAFPKVTVSQAQSFRFLNGGALDLKRIPSLSKNLPVQKQICVYSPEKLFLGIGEIGDSELKVLRPFELPQNLSNQ